MESKYDLIYNSIKDSKTEHREIYDELISLVLNLKGGIKYIKKSCKVEALQCSDGGRYDVNDNYKKIDKIALRLTMTMYEAVDLIAGFQPYTCYRFAKKRC